jgi:hypothetical protein
VVGSSCSESPFRGSLTLLPLIHATFRGHLPNIAPIARRPQPWRGNRANAYHAHFRCVPPQSASEARRCHATHLWHGCRNHLPDPLATGPSTFPTSSSSSSSSSGHEWANPGMYQHITKKYAHTSSSTRAKRPSRRLLAEGFLRAATIFALLRLQTCGYGPGDWF